MLSFDVDTGDAQRDLGTLTDRLERAPTTRAEMTELGELVVRRAKALAPVRTGRLRASIEAMIAQNRTAQGRFASGFNAVISTDVDYAGYQEFGTRFIRPRRFMRGAVEESDSDIRMTFERAIDRFIARETRRQRT